ncbi:DUF5067 domain-containing protein (plasmid) [Bombilactobacillus folatiphilus]|uniref:DUF5067 domain-containing protein n=1 Tax=Bombilactobacillus folatiphilus TaxID=2923362 RepID=A0ABY4PAY3_9LACO|nr:DUF5067 domain-containing protein [Bombilactobacillus folatiphilus]UQS81429.1 DUF5067 domain-containing protein [Bombilactobacillus folatiphilus]UQS82838.1 DUF5067 domain-containing protein [Bombilactobacillus folatiphilus]UQS82944.1 DUF5067 domain-containing protein [Bombilactobacillus folatiphilus]
MNKGHKLTIITLLSAILLSGCDSKFEIGGMKFDIGGNISTDQNHPSATTFQNGIFENRQTKIKILKTQVGHSNKTQSDGLIVTFWIQNKSKHRIKPSALLNYLNFHQSNSSSNYDLRPVFNVAAALFPTINSDGSSTADASTNIGKATDYNQKYVKPLNAQLLPGKSIKVVRGYELNNKKHPVFATAKKDMHNVDSKSVGTSYKINLQDYKN